MFKTNQGATPRRPAQVGIRSSCGGGVRSCLAFAVAGALVAMCSAVTASADQPDYARETRIAEQIEPAIFDGEATWLTADDREFLGIYLAAESATTAVLILHGRDVSPEEQHLVGPLRVGLAENGFSTLAIQMPVLEKGKTYYDYLPILPFGHERIAESLAFLRGEGYEKIIIAAHSCGAHMANHWLNANGDSAIDGYIAMGLGATDRDQDLETPFPIGDMRVPVLDIYGSEEFPRPLAMVPERRALLKQNGHPLSAQIEVEGANHYFTDYGDAMVDQLTPWLNSVSE